MELEFIFIEFRPFKLSYFWQLYCIVGYGVCVICSSYSFQWISYKFCRHIVDILEMCRWVLEGARINFDRMTFFLNLDILVAVLPCRV